MSIVTNDITQINPVSPYGMAICDGGLLVGGSVNGYGLVTRGFLWQLFSVWFDSEYYAPLTTSWTDSDAVITTTWTSSPTGSLGDYFA